MYCAWFISLSLPLFQTTPPVTHQEMGGANVHDEVILIHNRDDVDESEFSHTS